MIFPLMKDQTVDLYVELPVHNEKQWALEI